MNENDRLKEAQEQAAADEIALRSNTPYVVFEDGSARSVFDDQPGTRVDGAFGRGTLSHDGNVLTLDFPQSQPNNLQPGTAPKVTPADIEAEIASEHYFTAHEAVHIAGGWPEPEIHTSLKLLTFCVLVLRNGFTVTGESACASPENFDAEVGRKVARQAAVAKCWPLLGFRLRDRLHAQAMFDAEPKTGNQLVQGC